jgi:hypothetical protein
MSYDYSDDVLFANEMVNEFGRLVSLSKFSTTPVTSDFPLEGSSAPLIVTNITAVFVSTNGLGFNIDTTVGLWKEAQQAVILASDGVNDFTTFDSLIDTDMTDWKIVIAEKLQPGDTIVMFVLGVKR